MEDRDTPKGPEGSGQKGSFSEEELRERALRKADQAARKKMLKATGNYSYIGIEFGVVVIAGYFIGKWLDDKYDTAPYLMYLCLGLGFATAFRDLFRLVRRTNLDSMDDPE